MNKAQIESYRIIFLKMLNHLNNEDFSSLATDETKGDDIDLAITDRARALRIKLSGRKEYFVKKINDALLRIEEGTFGICFECGEDIEKARLNARPTATCCITCKEEQERDEEHISYQKKSHTHGKEIQNDNIVNLPINNEEIAKEKILEFNRSRISIGLMQ